MKTRSFLMALPVVLGALGVFGFAAPARAESPGQAAQRLRVDAQFERARANEFRKFAGEDEGVARARLAQAADLERDANNYTSRAQFHAGLAAQYDNPGQRELAQACNNMAGELRRMANERRNMANGVIVHVAQWRNWANAMELRAQNDERWAQQLESAGRL